MSLQNTQSIGNQGSTQSISKFIVLFDFCRRLKGQKPVTARGCRRYDNERKYEFNHHFK